MTIIAGFRCHDGVVVCADTQETVDFSKRNVKKVRVEPWFMHSPTLFGNSVAITVCGAGEGPFIDHLSSRAWNAAKSSESLDEACCQIETAIKNAYQEYGSIFQQGYCPLVELIYGVKYGQESRLFSAHGPVINEVEEYCTGGIGSYMADYLASRMFTAGLSLHQCVILAAYILLQAKEHVVGCGGDSHIAILRHDGSSGLVDRSRVEAITKLLDAVDRQLGDVLLASADFRSTTEVSEKLKIATDIIDLYRTGAADEIANHDRMDFLVLLPGDEEEDRDELGFKVPSKNKSSD